jgi:hypothetical protein
MPQEERKPYPEETSEGKERHKRGLEEAEEVRAHNRKMEDNFFMPDKRIFPIPYCPF